MDALAAPGFRDAVLALPALVALHVFEEWPGFPRWARRFASPDYSDRSYLVTHAVALAGALATALLVRAFPAPWLLFAFFALWLGPGVFCNGFFHLGASWASRRYCPGVVTGVLLYVPYSLWLAALAVHEGRIGGTALALALPIAAAFHALEVGRNVFARW